MNIKYCIKLVKVFVTAILVMNQAVFLLLPNISVFAQTAAPTINFVSPPTGTISGTITFHAAVSGTINGLPTIHFPGGYGSREMSQNGDVYYFNLDTTDSLLLANQPVYLSVNYLIGTVNYSVESQSIYITINNTPSPITSLTVSFLTPSSETILSGLTQLQVQTSEIDAHLILSLMTNDGAVINPSMEKTRDATGKIFTANLNTLTLTNGRYKIKAEATKEGYNSAIQEIFFYASNNIIPTFLDLNFISPPSIITESADITVQTNQAATVNFMVYKNSTAVNNFPSTYQGSNQYYFNFDISNLENGSYYIRALAEKSGYTTVSKITYITINKPVTPPVVTAPDYFINFIDEPTFVSGPMSISAQTNFSADSVTFTVTGPQTNYFTGTNNGDNKYSFYWDITNFLVGDYQIKATASINGTYYNDLINVNYTKEEYTAPIPATTTSDAITYAVSFLNMPASPVSGDKKISIGVNNKVDGAQFEIKKDGRFIKKYPGIRTDSQHFYFNWPTREFSDGRYEIIAGVILSGAVKASNSTFLQLLNNPITTPVAEPAKTTAVTAPVTQPIKTTTVTTPVAEPAKTTISNTTTSNTATSLSNQPVTSAPAVKVPVIPAAPYLMPLCQEKGITDNEKCQIFMSLEPACRDSNITSQVECNQFLATPQECRINKLIGTDCDNYMNFPKECRVANILSKEKCEEYTKRFYLPASCQNAGILTQEECKNFIFTLNLPIACQEANVKSQTECSEILEKKNTNQENINNIQVSEECLAQNIKEADKCQVFLNQKYLARECREAGVTDKNECDKLMFEKYSPDECVNAGINDRKECENYIFNKYSSRVSCENLELWECMNKIQQNYLGTIIAKQSSYGKIKESSLNQNVISFKAKDLFSGSDKTAVSLPIKDSETGIRIINTEEKIVLNKTNNLIQTSPVAIMIDGDEDGLPDDLERRLGTDPAVKDSDGDGYSDGQEIINGYNPLGEGKLNSDLSPVDEAIIKNEIFNHPKTEGQISEALNIDKVISNSSSTEEQKYLINGQAEPNKVITLYIYSDLPIIATVKTDEFGNWQYELGQSLTEGEHEIYIAVNDNTGKIISKGNPLSFFIKEAKAVSVDDFLATAQVQTTKKSESYINYYLIISGLMIIAGIFIFLLFFIKYRKQENINQ